MKKVSIVALAVLAAAFTTYKAFDNLAKSLEKTDIDWDEDINNE